MSYIDPVEAFLDVHTFPHEQGEWQKLANGEITLTHYTSAEAAYNIISSKKIYMRDARFTNDKSEINYGFDLFERAFKGKYANLYLELFKKIDFDLIDRYNSTIVENFSILLLNNYIFCLFEQDSSHNHEIQNGNLSMWREYGAPNGVCFQFNGKVTETNLVNPVLSKIKYWTYEELDAEMNRFYNLMNDNIEIISSNKSILLGKILNKFRYDIAFMKNPSFRQENEWRLVCFPKNFEALDYRIENVVINSVPQLVVTVPFSTQLKTSFNDILSRIVIGQSRYAELIQRSIVDLLRVGGVDNPNERVILSEIPAVFRS